MHIVMYERSASKYVYMPGTTKTVCIPSVIMGVQLNVCDDGTFTLDEHDQGDLVNFIANENNKPK